MRNVGVTLLATCCVLLTAVGQIALKAGVSHSALSEQLSAGHFLPFFIRAITTPLVIVGLFLYAVSTVLWLVVLTRADLSYAFPLVSLGFVITAAYGHFVLHEDLSLPRVAGIALIVCGVIFVSRS